MDVWSVVDRLTRRGSLIVTLLMKGAIISAFQFHVVLKIIPEFETFLK